jgi:uncharacterized membrane protein YphA (DoxX/SURF4 family)
MATTRFAQISGAKVSVALWTVQALLAALFLFAGVMKLVLPIEAMTEQLPLPALFLRFVGVVETLGGLGLILPGLLRIRPELTPLAAAGLVEIMVGATLFTPAEQPEMALIPGVVGLLAGLVAYGRWQLAPHRSRQLRSIQLSRSSSAKALTASITA